MAQAMIRKYREASPRMAGSAPSMAREEKGQPKSNGAHQHTEQPYKAQRLPGDALGVLLAAGAQVLGHLHGKAYRGRVEQAVKQPGGAGGQPPPRP